MEMTSEGEVESVGRAPPTIQLVSPPTTVHYASISSIIGYTNLTAQPRPGFRKHYQNNLSFPSYSSGEVCSQCTHARTQLTLDQPPTYPYIAGPLNLPDPPLRLYPDLVPSLSRRPLLFPSRTLATAPPPPNPASPVMLSLA